MKLYKIRDWNRLFENNRSRTVENPRWVPIPNRHDGENYSALITSKDGAQIFAAFILMLEVASRCHERGTLIRSNGIPHDAASLSQKTRAPQIWFERSLDYLIKHTDWLEVVDITDTACGCHPPDSPVTADCQPPDPSHARARASIPSIPFNSEGGAGGNGKPPVPEESFENLRSEKFKTTWAVWIGHLKQKGTKPTEHARYLQLKRCSKWGEERAIAAIEHSIEHGWQSIYEERKTNERNQNNRPGASKSGNRNVGTLNEGRAGDYDNAAQKAV